MAPNYLYYSHRLASFDSQTVPAAAAKGSRAAKNITFSWPHPPTFGATPQTLAAAGFYYAPEQGSEDRVICVFCDVGLANWEKMDSPFEEHYTRNEDGCLWAAARCSLEKDRVKRGKSLIWKFSSPSRIPTDPARYNARLHTFKGWPYDKAKGHKCTSKALARAGFVFAPDDDGYEDMAKCFYCNRELSGWSPDDDPLAEHRRHEGANCPFLKAYDEQIADEQEEQTPQPKPKRRVTRTVSTTTARSRPSKASRSTRTRQPSTTKYRASPSVASSSAQESESDLNDPPLSRTRAGSTASFSQPPNRVTKKAGRSKSSRAEVKTEDEESSIGKGRQKEREPSVSAQESDSDLNVPSPRRTRALSSISISQTSNPASKKVGRPKKVSQVQAKMEAGESSTGQREQTVPPFSGQESELDSNDLPLTRSRAGSSTSTIQTSNHGTKKSGRSKAPRSEARTGNVEPLIGNGKHMGPYRSTEESESEPNNALEMRARGGLPSPVSQDFDHVAKTAIRSKSPQPEVAMEDEVPSTDTGKEALAGISVGSASSLSGPTTNGINGVIKPAQLQPPDSPTPRKQRSQPQPQVQLQNDPFDSRPLQSNAISASTLDALSPFLNALPPGGLTPAQLDMTIQEFIVSETQRAYDAMKRDGERLKRELMEESKRQRAIVVELLMKAPTTTSLD